MECERVQRAIDLANYYKDEILSKYGAIIYVFQKIELTDILNTVKQSDIKNFDMNEFERLFTVVQRREIEKIIHSEEIIKAIVETEMILGEEMQLKKYTKIEVDESNGQEKIVLNAKGLHKQFMSGIISQVLNNLEYFAMHFTHKTADKTVVYQSLHQTYLQMVQMLYYNIAQHNDGTTKYYTNVIELYNDWYKKSQEQKENISNTSSRLIEKGTVAEIPK